MIKLLLFGAALWWAPVLSAAAADTSKPLDFKFTTPDGNTVDVATMRGKVVLIFFWATWSKPSRDEVPAVVAARKKYRSQGFEVIGVSIDSDLKTMQTYVNEYSMNWPEFFDLRGPQIRDRRDAFEAGPGDLDCWEGRPRGLGRRGR